MDQNDQIQILQAVHHKVGLKMQIFGEKTRGVELCGSKDMHVRV